jgi:pimeloyl-ACP methyl ester carboxylesterase
VSPLPRRGTKVLRPLDWTFPPERVEREIVRREAGDGGDRPPLLFVHGMNQGAWAWAEHWMPAAAERGWDSCAVSLRGHGASGGHDDLRRWKLRDYEHDVMQAVIELPRPPVIVGHSMGAQVVRRVLERYVAPAAVLLCPPGGRSGLGVMGRFAGRRPAAFARAVAAQPIVLDAADLFGPEMPADDARRHTARMTPEAPLAQYELMLRPQPARSRSPVLVVGAGEDALVSVTDLVRTARIYGTKAHVFRGMGHDLMLEPRWREPLDLVLDWAERTVKT